VHQHFYDEAMPMSFETMLLDACMTLMCPQLRAHMFSI